MRNLKAALVLSGLILFGTTQSAQAAVVLITKTEIKNVIGSFPEKGDANEAADDAIMLDLQDTRTDAQCKAAALQSNDESLKSFFGDTLSSSERRFLNVYLLRVKAIAGANVAVAKKMYNRARPYVRNTDIKPCIELEGSSSYPSGHTTLARLYARVLSLRFPSRAAKFMAKADQAALNRVLGGVHHPSDVEAGKKLGDYLAKKFYK